MPDSNYCCKLVIVALLLLLGNVLYFFPGPFKCTERFAPIPYQCRSQIPIVLFSYNNPTLLKSLIDQLERCFNASVSVIDNGSTYAPMISYLNDLKARNITVYHMPRNFGPHVLFTRPEGRSVLSKLPQYFVLSDSDLRLNDHTPSNFLCIFAVLTDLLSTPKVGVALDLYDKDDMLMLKKYNGQPSIHAWERGMYGQRLLVPGWEEINFMLYKSLIDTTFAVYNKKHMVDANGTLQFTYSAVRVAGIFSAKHRPFYPKTFSALNESERNAMLSGNTGTIALALRNQSSIQNLKASLDLVQGGGLMSFACAGKKHVFPIPSNITNMFKSLPLS